LGPNTKLGGSLLVMAVVGGAFFPLIMGWVATKSTMARAMLVPLVSFAFIAYYSFVGSKKVGAEESPAVLAGLH
jgi:MFS transporter, FHS family, L-fucose permease